MYRRIPIKNHQEEIHLVTHRAIAALVLMCILIILLILRLAYLQMSKHDLYTTLSQKNWLDLVPLEPTRGLIFDRNGVLLAENTPVFSLDVIPDKIDSMTQTLSQVSKIVPLTDTEIAQFQKQLKQHRRFDEIPLKMRLTEEEVAKFSENQYRFPGVIIKARLIRHYPMGTSFIHVLGYVGRINTQDLNEIDATNYSASNYIGKLGIEKYYEDELHGTVGYEQAENDASGEPVRVLNRIKPIPGENLYLTIDSKLQLAVEEALGGHRGAVVVIQPSTGQVLAMVSQPTYDPNIFVSGISSQDFKALQQSPDRPLYNRALRGLYPPASTVKPYMALEGLDSEVTDTEYSIYDPGIYQLKTSSQIFHDWKRHGHGVVNLPKAIMVSCDVYFFDLAFKMGIQRIDEILHKFGYGQLTGIDLDEELAGNVASPTWKKKVKGINWYPGDTLNSGIGQGYMQVTPLQLASAIATLANRGQRYTPHLLLSEQEPGKAAVPSQPTRVSKIELNDDKYWNIVINAMQNVIQSPEGTGYRRFGHDAPYTVAAKTGTAQVFTKKHYDMTVEHDNQDLLPERLRDNSLFVAFAPVDHPRIAIAVVVENSLLAASIARKILDYYLIGPQALKPPTPVTTADPKKDETPSDEDETNDVH
ncbi:MAG: penicillin-binding protein 2 [Gammaproteobacteria bacterium]